MVDSDIPHDLLLLILIRLPVKPLSRFKCVSKSWNILISSKLFANMHLKQSLVQPKPLGLIWFDELMKEERIRRMHIFAVDCSKLEDLANTIHRLHYPLDVPSSIVSTLIGSCNGLLCLILPCINGSMYDESFLVFNPLIRKGLTIYGQTCWCQRGRSYYYGFGYDDVHDDYKVVTWGIRIRPTQGSYSDCSKFDVYSVKKGSWNRISSGLTSYYIDGIKCGVLVNGVLHWMWKNTNDRYSIVAFDLRTEEHMLMETPENDLSIPGFDEDEEQYYCRMELGALNGCLCGIELDYEVPNKLDLWIMKEYGLKDSWIKMTIDMCVDEQFAGGVHTKLGNVTPIVPIVYVKNKKQMMLYSYEKGFLVCDMVTDKLSKVIKIPEFDPRGNDKRALRYSFVPKEFCFQGSLVKLVGFDSFDSLWYKYTRLMKERQEEKKNARTQPW